MTTTTLFGALLLGLGITTLLIPPILRIANQKRLFDLPDHRKTHLTPTPALGGVGFFISFWLVIICLADFDFLSDNRFVLVAATLLFLVGVQDDLAGVGFSVKFVWQAFAAVMLFLSGFQMEGFYGVFGWGDLPTWGAFIMTLLTVVYLINAYNLIDGVNGLAGSLGVVGSAGFGALFWWNGEPEWSFMAATMTGVLLGFLKYNYGKAKIFMGDNGSMFLGLMMSVFFIHYLNSAPANGEVPSLLWALALVLVPAFDLLRVFAFRLLKRQSPFSADRTHIHHLLQALGKSHEWVVRTVLSIQLLVLVCVPTFLAEKNLTVALVYMGGLLLCFIGLVRLSQSLTEIKKMETERHYAGFLE